VSSAPARTAAAGRQRRPTAEVRSLIVKAAAEAFAAKGFGGARISAIAESAGVSRSALFRHFRTKEDLFTAATLEPFRNFAAHWQELLHEPTVDARGGEQVITAYVEALLELVQQHRDAVRAYLFDDNIGRESMGVVLEELVEVARRYTEQRGLRIASLDLRVRFSVAMVVAVNAMDGWLPARELSRAEIARELSTIVQRGALAR
jgi:AcrR family transcriptional regulator